MTKLRCLAGVYGLAASAASIGASAQLPNVDTTGWETYRDARLAVTLLHPPGWTAKTSENTVIIKSPDGGILAAAEAFKKQEGDTARARVGAFVSAHPELLPSAQMPQMVPRPVAGDEVIGTLVYQASTGGYGYARVMCLMREQTGTLYAMAAPREQWAQQAPTVVGILRSLKSTPAASAGTAASKHAADSPKRPAMRVVAHAPAPVTQYSKWLDPKEKAFTAEVPAGWKVEGGAIRAYGTDVRNLVVARSPVGDMILQVGDASLPHFTTPAGDQGGVIFHGQVGNIRPTVSFLAMLLPYMPSSEFNKWYLEQVLGKSGNRLRVTAERDRPEVARRFQELGQRIGNSTEVTASVASFEGVTGSGIPILGKIFSYVTASPPGQPRYWSAHTVLGIAVNDKYAAARLDTLWKAAGHVEESIQIDRQWSAKERELIADANRTGQQLYNETLRGSRRQTNAYAQEFARGPDTSTHMRQFLNYLSDQTDLVDPATGRTHKGVSGLAHYYETPGGYAVGTNSHYNPPVGFTPLKEF